MDPLGPPYATLRGDRLARVSCLSLAMAALNRILVSALLVLSVLLVVVVAQDPKTEYVYGTGPDGVTRELPVNRFPALYTGDFGDCLGGESLFNITKFDAAYYADNLTIVFHLDGTSNIRNESLMSKSSTDSTTITFVVHADLYDSADFCRRM